MIPQFAVISVETGQIVEGGFFDKGAALDCARAWRDRFHNDLDPSPAEYRVVDQRRLRERS